MPLLLLSTRRGGESTLPVYFPNSGEIFYWIFPGTGTPGVLVLYLVPGTVYILLISKNQESPNNSHVVFVEVS